MTGHENKIPIKGYATFDPLKHCWIGSGFKSEWFRDLAIYNNDKIMDPLKRIAEETEEDYQALEKILKDAGVETHRSFLDMDRFKSLQQIGMPPSQPRDNFAVIGEKIYIVGVDIKGYEQVLRNIARQDIYIDQHDDAYISTANICRVGKDIWWDVNKRKYSLNIISEDMVSKYKQLWEQEGFRVHVSRRGYHSDSSFCVVKPGCIISLRDIQDYNIEFPGWDVLYLPDQSWTKVSPFLQMKDKVGGRWWLNGEEHNDQLINFVNVWLNDWVGYVQETVFDVNMLSLDQNTIICNNYNKEVFSFFKRHKVEPILFNFRHRYFWDGGIHCITQDLYREGKMEDYFG